MQERRAINRDRTYRGARITYNNRLFSVDCLIRNLSPQGAKIAVPHAVGLPSNFDLTLVDTQQTRRAEIVWARDGALGVVFAP